MDSQTSETQFQQLGRYSIHLDSVILYSSTLLYSLLLCGLLYYRHHYDSSTHLLIQRLAFGVCCSSFPSYSTEILPISFVLTMAPSEDYLLWLTPLHLSASASTTFLQLLFVWRIFGGWTSTLTDRGTVRFFPHREHLYSLFYFTTTLPSGGRGHTWSCVKDLRRRLFFMYVLLRTVRMPGLEARLHLL